MSTVLSFALPATIAAVQAHPYGTGYASTVIPIEASLTAGAGTMTVAPSAPTWCWIFRHVGVDGTTRVATVADSGGATVDYLTDGSVVTVDPVDFIAVPATVGPSWQADIDSIAATAAAAATTANGIAATANTALAQSGVTSVASRAGAVTLTKTDVGLSSVDNTADAAKPVSTAQQTALNLKVSKGDVTLNAADYASLSAVITAAPAGATITLPAGTYSISSLTGYNKSLTFVGVNADTTIVSAGSNAYGFAFPASGSGVRLTFRQIGFTGSTSAIFTLSRSFVYSTRFIECAFKGFTAAAVQSFGTNVSFYRCTFASNGRLGSTIAVQVYRAPERVRVEDCTFNYLSKGVYITGTNGGPGEVVVTGSTFDGGFMYLAASASGSGAGTVTYTGTTVTDTGAAFGTIPAGTTVRAMAVKCASTITSITSVDVTDTASDFVALGVSRGDILRTGTTWAVVSSVVSTSTLRVEQWIDSATYEQAPVPAVSASFTVYGLVRGTVQSNTSTVLTVRAWRNWDGTLVTPAAGTLYEVTVNVDYSGVFVVGSGKVRVTNNTFRRTWADAITALTSTDIVVSGNTISDTQDVGVTIGLPDSTYSTNRFTVADNVMNHIGSAGIWVGSATDGTITGNVINEAGWSQDQATASYGGIMIQFGSRLAVSNNIVRRVNQPGAVHAIHVFQSGAAGYTKPTNIAFNDNQTFGYGSGGRFDLRISGGGVAGWVTGMTGRFQADSVIAVADSADPPTGTFRGAGAPAVPAGVGSTYLRSDGGAGSTLYVKESGTGTSGWIAK